MDAEALERLLIEEGTRWIEGQRDRVLVEGRALAVSERLALGAYLEGFPGVDDVRIEFVPRLRNPPFYETLPFAVRRRMIDFESDMCAITFASAISARRDQLKAPRQWTSTLLHELVHVAQCAMLGVNGFVKEYVRGFAAGGFDYGRIPLEVMAYDLQRRFDRHEPFEAWSEVARALDWRH